MHYDAFSWQVASPLFTGVAVFWGFLVQHGPTGRTIGVSGFLIALLLTSWILYADHNRQIYLAKLRRLHELEAELGMWQHRVWTAQAEQNGRTRVHTFGFRGHHLDRAVYGAASLGAPLIAVASGTRSWWLLLPLPVVIATLVATAWWQRRIKALLDGTQAGVNTAE
jgi:hypothetical protein